MLKILKGDFSSRAREELYSEIAELSAKKIKSYLIVPEQMTVMAEGVMSRLLPPEAALVFEVTNFTRLANTVFRTIGGLSGEYSDKAKKSLIMWRALTELSPLLSHGAGRGDVSYGLVEKNLAAVAELQSLGIHPDELAACCENNDLMKDRRLLNKISDLSKIYQLYKKLHSERYSDTGDDCEALVRLLSEHREFLSDTVILVEGYTSFTEPQYKLLGALSARTDVTVLLTLPRGREEAFEFTELRECQGKIVAEARRSGADVNLLRANDDEKADNAFATICDNLWCASADNVNITLQNMEDVRIFEAKTPFDECEFICSDIKRRVMAGASYSDFAIVARSVDKYTGILDTALARSGIPAFMSLKRDISEFEAIKLIYTAYAAARGFLREDVISYSKCHGSGVTREESDEFEIYVNTWQINGKRFVEDGIWNMHPDGFSIKRTEKTGEKLLRIDAIRRKIIDPLEAFAEALTSASTTREHAKVLYDFLVSIGLEESLERRAESLDMRGEHEYAEENRALWKIICSSLDTVVTVLGDTPATQDAFLLQLKVAFGSADIGRIPSYVDEVTVGSADMLRLYGKPHVYMIGLNEGEFPSFADDNSYFSEHDKLLISRAGVEFPPALEVRNARELYIFSRAFSYAEKSVTLSYSSTTARFKASTRSSVLDRISELCHGLKTRRISELTTRESLYSAPLALGNMGDFADDYPSVRAALCESGYTREVDISEGSIENGDCKITREIRADERSPLSLSQSQIDSFVKCPFSWFCRYPLDLSDVGVAELDSRSIGLLIHAILENFFTAQREMGKSIESLTDVERRELTRLSAERYLSCLGDDTTFARASTRIKIERLCRAAEPLVSDLCKEFSKSRFTPRFFELSLNDSDDDAPSCIRLRSEDGRVVRIKGTIDRVDTYFRGDDVFVRVVDYKTGSKVFSETDMAEGRNLQMFLYLKAVVESDSEGFVERLFARESKSDEETKRGKAYAAGVIYVKTPVGDERVDLPDDSLAEAAIRASHVRSGMLLEDDDVISARGVEYTPLSSTSDPTKIDDKKRKFLYNDEGWKKIMKDVETSVFDVADRMISGDIPSKPDKGKSEYSPCGFCEYKPLCRKVKI